MKNKLKSLIHEMRWDIGTEDEMADFLLQHDVVPVVRCKDCKYWDECRIGEGLCEHPVNGITRDYTIGIDYCSYGERKADNDT